MRVLLLLDLHARSIKSLCLHLDVNEQTLIPHVKILEEHYLIETHSETYELTTIGKLLADKLASFMETVSEIDSV